MQLLFLTSFLDENKKPIDALLQLNQLANEEAAKPRAKLMLSAPQLSDEQLEELAKLGNPEVATDTDEEVPFFLYYNSRNRDSLLPKLYFPISEQLPLPQG